MFSVLFGREAGFSEMAFGVYQTLDTMEIQNPTPIKHKDFIMTYLVESGVINEHLLKPHLS